MQEAVTAHKTYLKNGSGEQLTLELTIISPELGSENASIEKLGF